MNSVLCSSTLDYAYDNAFINLKGSSVVKKKRNIQVQYSKCFPWFLYEHFSVSQVLKSKMEKKIIIILLLAIAK